jgi:hypothetical protein
VTTPSFPPVTTIASAKENIAPITVPCIRNSAASKEPPTARPSLVPTMATVTAAHSPLPLVAQPIEPATAAAHDSLVAYASCFASSAKSHRSKAPTVSARTASPADETEVFGEVYGFEAVGVDGVASSAGDARGARMPCSPMPSLPPEESVSLGSFPGKNPMFLSAAKDAGNDDARFGRDETRRFPTALGRFVVPFATRSRRSSRSPHASHSTSSVAHGLFE